MGKQYQPSAGARPEFVSASITATNRKVRVTGKRITPNGNHPLRALHYETHTVKGHENNMAYQADCECFPIGVPSDEMLEFAANTYLYGSAQVASNRRSRRFHDNRANVCAECRVLMPVSLVCPTCS
jgi:hypothetical protein